MTVTSNHEAVIRAAEKAARSFRSWADQDRANGDHERANRMMAEAEFHERIAADSRARLNRQSQAA